MTGQPETEAGRLLARVYPHLSAWVESIEAEARTAALAEITRLAEVHNLTLRQLDNAARRIAALEKQLGRWVTYWGTDALDGEVVFAETQALLAATEPAAREPEAGPDDACAECYRQGWEAGHAAREPGLDVDRLAQAMRNETLRIPLGTFSDASLTDARRVAAEYARLKESQP